MCTHSHMHMRYMREHLFSLIFLGLPVYLLLCAPLGMYIDMCICGSITGGYCQNEGKLLSPRRTFSY